MMARPLPRPTASYSLLLSCLLSLAFLTLLPADRAAAQAPVDTYTVQSGDTLASIAALFGIAWEELAAANEITGATVLRIGQILNLPEGSAKKTLTAARPGDTIRAIAEREGLSASRLSLLNRTGPTVRLFPGQPIRRPADALPPDPALRFGSVRIVNLPRSVVQGQAGWLQLEVDRPLLLKAQWNGLPLGLRPLAIRQNEATVALGTATVTVWGGYLPTPALMGPGVLPLSLSYVARSGTSVTRTFPVQVQEGRFPRQQIELPPEKSALLDQELLQAELDYLWPVWSRTATMIQWRQPFVLPLPSTHPMSSPYGIRRSYNGGPYDTFHTGQDFAAPGGTLVVAPADGIVALTESLTVRGLSVVLDHGAGLFTGYWHLSEALVTPGASVQAGDSIGLVGTTGLSTGEHLHWELRLYGLPVDPTPYLTKPLFALAPQDE